MSELLEAPTETLGEELETSHEIEIQPPAPETTEPEIKAVCATLYLPRQKGERRVTVHGWSGKYEFKWCPLRRKIVRDYTSPAEFTREEEDIRKRVGNPIIVCTLLGSTDLAGNAKEAVQCLIDARLKVARDNRLAALTELAGIVGAAIAELEEPSEEEAEEEIPLQSATLQVCDSATLPLCASTGHSEEAPAPLGNAGLMASEEGITVPAEVQPPVEQPLTVTNFHGYDEPALMKLGFDDLKALATRFHVKMKPPSRVGIAKDLLPYYRAGAPTSWIEKP